MLNWSADFFSYFNTIFKIIINKFINMHQIINSNTNVVNNNPKKKLIILND